MDPFKLEQICKICHETNRAALHIMGNTSEPTWEEATESMKESTVNSVLFMWDNPLVSAVALHNVWYLQKIRTGWKYGPVKNEDKKEHPCLVTYDKLPINERLKDYLFRGVVAAFRECVEE